MVRTHLSTINRFYTAPAHAARPHFPQAASNAPTMGAAGLRARAAATLAAGAAGLAALPFCAGPASHALGAASADPCTAILLNALLLFALAAGAVTGLFGVASGLGDLLGTDNA